MATLLSARFSRISNLNNKLLEPLPGVGKCDEAEIGGLQASSFVAFVVVSFASARSDALTTCRE
jgi:hypothetical protein